MEFEKLIIVELGSLSLTTQTDQELIDENYSCLGTAKKLS